MVRKILKTFVLIGFSLVFIYLGACADSSDCRYIDNRKVKLSFAKKSGKVIADSIVSKLSVIILENGKHLYDSVSATTMSLNLSQNSDSSIFILKLNNVSDILKFFYTRNLEMISSDCGFNTRFTIDSFSYSRHNIDYIVKLEAVVDKDVNKNFTIVLRKASEIDTKSK